MSILVYSSAMEYELHRKEGEVGMRAHRPAAEALADAIVYEPFIKKFRIDVGGNVGDRSVHCTPDELTARMEQLASQYKGETLKVFVYANEGASQECENRGRYTISDFSTSIAAEIATE